MIVKINQTVDIEADVQISVEDIRLALFESFRDPHDPDFGFETKCLLNSIHQILAAFDEETLAKLDEEHRDLFANALAKHADRIRVSSVPIRG